MSLERYLQEQWDWEPPTRDRHQGRHAHMLDLADVILPTYCACGQLLERTEDLDRHVERGCWREEK